MADWREDFARRLERKKAKAGDTLASIYQQAAREILGTLVALGDETVDASRNGQILGQILPILQRLSTRATLTLGTLMTEAYRHTRQEVLRLAILRGVEKPPEGPALGIVFDRIPEERVRTLADSSLEYIKAVDADLKARIRQQMGIGIVRGESTHQIARRIAGTGLTVDGINTPFHTVSVRADVIARTETARVQAVTVQETIRQVTEVSPHVLLEWCAALERACKLCQALDGKRAPVGETFDGFTVPRHPRCRCVIVPYVPPAAVASKAPMGNAGGMLDYERMKTGDQYQGAVGQLSATKRAEVVDVANRAGLADYLHRHPLNEIRFVTRDALGKDVFGGYDPFARDVHIRASRPTDTFGQPFVPGMSKTVSEAGSGVTEALQRTFVHETGHHILHQLGAMTEADCEVRGLIRDTYRGAKDAGRCITVRAANAWHEYFAECHTAYVFEREALQKHDPMGYNLVEEIRRRIGARLL